MIVVDVAAEIAVAVLAGLHGASPDAAHTVLPVTTTAYVLHRCAGDHA